MISANDHEKIEQCSLNWASNDFRNSMEFSNTPQKSRIKFKEIGQDIFVWISKVEQLCDKTKLPKIDHKRFSVGIT